jgi:N-acetylglutamate synthase-like GNAT family acetyltransferase
VHRLPRAPRRRREGRRVGLTVAIRPARREEAEALTELAVRAKGHWGHDAAFLARARPELTVTPGDIERALVRVAERDGEVVGFSAIDLALDPPELVALFVEPAAIGTGAGRALLARAREEAAAAGVAELAIESDPDAEGFYRAQGAVPAGERRSSSTGRVLPLLRIPTAP